MVYSNHKIYIVFLLTATFLGGCSTLNLSTPYLDSNTEKWQDRQLILANTERLQVGDILIKPKNPLEPISWWGHSAIIVNDDLLVGEYPKLGYGYVELPLHWWLNDKSKIKILRYKGFNAKFRQQLLINLKQTEQFNYSLEYTTGELLQNKNKKIGFYCSSYIWYLYAKTAQDLGYKLDIDSDGGDWVMPYDFLDSKELYHFQEITK